MAFRFQRNESAASGFRRIIREQTAAGVSLLADRGNDLGTRVHDARRHIKRMRAILQLAGYGFDSKTLAKHDDALAAVARRLAGTRDADACVATFETLTSKLPFAEHTEVHEHFRELARISRRATSASQLGKIATSLRAAGTAIAREGLDHDEWDLVAEGFEKSYREARKLRRLAGKKASHAELHSWRKRLKQLFHQLELVCAILPKPLRKAIKRLEQLASALGEHHDLHVLEASLQDYQQHARDAQDIGYLRELIDERRESLCKTIRKIASDAFCEKPKPFLRAIHKAWKAEGIGDN
jgi:CHAD domain-containing protein